MNESLEKCRQIKNADLGDILVKLQGATQQEEVYDLCMIYAMVKYGKIVTRPEDVEEYTIYISSDDLERAYDEVAFEMASFIGEAH